MKKDLQFQTDKTGNLGVCMCVHIVEGYFMVFVNFSVLLSDQYILNH